MKRYAAILWIVLLLMGMFSGCSRRRSQPDDAQGQEITETIQLYYADINNEKFVMEEGQITYRRQEDKYKAALEELIKGPKNEDHRNNIPSNTTVRNVSRENDDLIVDFSKEFQQFGGSIAEIFAVGSVVNTMIQFEEVNRVKILVDGRELYGPSGEPRGFMTVFPMNPTEEGISTEAILYYGNRDATAVVAETRNIRLPFDIQLEDYIKRLLEELIKGPQREDLYPTIPKEVKVLSVEVENNIAFVDFSEEMHTKHWHGAAGESMTINSIVNTLTEIETIHKVKMTVEGEPLNIEHAILEEPVERNEEMIQK